MPRPSQPRSNLQRANRSRNKRRNGQAFTRPGLRDLQVVGDGPRGTSDRFGRYDEPSSARSSRLEGAANKSPIEGSESGNESETREELNESDEWSEAGEEQEYPSGESEEEGEEGGIGERKEKTTNHRKKSTLSNLRPSDYKSLVLEDSDKNKRNNQLLLKRITLSQDRTSGSDYSQKKLLALTNNGRSAKDSQKGIVRDTHGLTYNQLQSLQLRQQNMIGSMMTKETQMREQASPPRKFNIADIISRVPVSNISASSSRRESDSSMSNPRDVWDHSLEKAIASHTQYERDNEQPENMSQYEQLMDRIKSLEQENIMLRRFVDPDSTHYGPPFSQVLYRFKGNNRVFLRPPTWTRNTSQGKVRYTLKGDALSMKADEYLKRSRALAFAVFRTYASESLDDLSKEQDQEADMWPVPEPEAETILFVSDYMKEALYTYLDKQPSFKELSPRFDAKKEIPAPYLFWYCCRFSHESVLEELSPRHRCLMELFAHWMTSNYEKEYTHVDDQLSRGVISSAYMKYLVKPGDVLVSSKKEHFQAYMAKSWAEEKPITKHDSKGEQDIEIRSRWQVNVWSYDFDGSFYRKATALTIEINIEDPTEEVALRDLSVVPMRYADQETQVRLETRGQTYWECRKKKFVSCRSSNDIESMVSVSRPPSIRNLHFIDRSFQNNERFMIDFPTYKQLHPSDSETVVLPGDREEILPERMDLDEPPSAPELFLFPSTIIGFNLRRKKWGKVLCNPVSRLPADRVTVNLEVDLIRNVEWNKQAFESLVVEEETKELVQALVTNRLEAERGTDMIDDKGNGLTILLHGGPGTGKTFTAESVAELAEKPLYRVTCGDIGTHPEEVEQYLESALHLGKIWDCVVLLDEADVFLQERTLSDLKRNALVTVFLRVLEYYDGILILTSNRVGTFDEAFKSRIQLSLHYPNLSQSQRLKVWRNLINRLKRLDQPSIDFDDIECYLAELAEKNMNGREIRNAITTARQLAKFKGQKVSHAHLKHVINVAGRFEAYLSTVKEGFTDDDIARESGLR